ncbi:MAG: hemolysin III family protein [Pirellulales bacterium]|nr:hemolysin III family protein [Pirellulales bacterium]
MSTIPQDLRGLSRPTVWKRTPSEEFINTLTHALGFVLAVCGAGVMVWSVLRHGDAWRITGCLTFAGSLVAVYAASTLSHGCTNVRWKYFYRKLDQGFIYFLIVATYTPFGLAYLRTGTGWVLLGGLWTAACLGFFSKVILSHQVHNISMWSYVVLGWLPFIAVPALRPLVPANTAWWMLGGCACYLLGTLFLAFDARVRHFHAIWHLLVIAGSLCHFLGILNSVAWAG